MKELLEKLANPCKPEPGRGITITIDLNLDDFGPRPEDLLAKKMMMKKIMGDDVCPLDPLEKLHSEMDSDGKTISFMDDPCLKDKPCPEMALDGFSEDLSKMLENLGPEDWDGQGFKKEKVEVYPFESDSGASSSRIHSGSV